MHSNCSEWEGLNAEESSASPKGSRVEVARRVSSSDSLLCILVDRTGRGPTKGKLSHLFLTDYPLMTKALCPPLHNILILLYLLSWCFGATSATVMGMSHMFASMERVPETVSLFVLGTGLLVAGVLLRKALRLYERIVARKGKQEFQASHTSASSSVTPYFENERVA